MPRAGGAAAAAASKGGGDKKMVTNRYGEGRKIAKMSKIQTDPHMHKVQEVLDGAREKTVEEIVDQEGVSQDIYLKYLKSELDSESACLELPLTIIVLISFSILAMTGLRQDQIYSIEHSLEFDIVENANFAWSHTMGHKGIFDVNSFADFWSWFRIGYLPLIVQASWPSSEDYPAAFGDGPYAGTAYDRGNSPSTWLFPGYDSPAPVKNDYMRYSKILGGIRLQQELAAASAELCVFPSGIDRDMIQQWYGKPCVPSGSGELPPDVYETEQWPDSRRVEWFLPEFDSLDQLQAKAIDMEDGCNLYAGSTADMEKCLCEGCKEQNVDGTLYPRQPWLDEQTKRAEVTIVVYNPQYGVYSYVGVNIFFNRGGTLYKFVNVMSSWSDLMGGSLQELIMIYSSTLIWVCMLLNVFVSETKEVISVVRSSHDRWYRTIKNDYLQLWNIIDWVSLVVGVLVVCLGVRMNGALAVANEATLSLMQASNENTTRELYLAANVIFVNAVENMCLTEKDYRGTLCVYPSIVMLRLFKSFAAQPRLALVTATLERAAQDMLHFFIVFLSVYYCMTVNSVLFFGQDVESFSTLFRASHTCFMAMFGDWDWQLMESVGQFKAIAWFWLFQIVMVLLLLNMLLAIIMEAYTHCKNKAEAAPTLWKQMGEMVRRRQQFKRGERVRLNDIFDVFAKEYQGDLKTMLSQKRMITVKYILENVPGIKKGQAKRLLCKALDEHRSVTGGDITDQGKIDNIKKMLENMNERETRINGDLTWTKDLVNCYESMEAGGDPEYDFHFSVDDQKGRQPCGDSLAGAVTSTSSSVGGIFVENMARIERWQDSFERQQNELHHLIAEMQLMVTQQARCVSLLSDAAKMSDAHNLAEFREA